uniref:Uncharacterized protein n=1 Tax=Anopheles maculatus TaxID=74869 RepID=A0A182SVW5_9DIPT
MTIFHEGPITDVFVANTTIPFDDLVTRNESEQQDFWVDLEPQGRLHVKIDLRWTQDANNVASQNSCRRTVVKDQPFLNRRRGAMRRRVHQVSCRTASVQQRATFHLVALSTNWAMPFGL